MKKLLKNPSVQRFAFAYACILAVFIAVNIPEISRAVRGVASTGQEMYQASGASSDGLVTIYAGEATPSYLTAEMEVPIDPSALAYYEKHGQTPPVTYRPPHPESNPGRMDSSFTLMLRLGKGALASATK